MHVVTRRVVVLDDADLAEALRNDELTEEELDEHIQDGSPVAYTLLVDEDAEPGFLCAATGIEPGEENELADSDITAMSWSPSEVADALEVLAEGLEDPEALATAIVAQASAEPSVEGDCDLSEVVDVLEKLDKGYEPDPDAHLAVSAAAWLVRHVLAFRVAGRHDAWVVSLSG